MVDQPRRPERGAVLDPRPARRDGPSDRQQVSLRAVLARARRHATGAAPAVEAEQQSRDRRQGGGSGRVRGGGCTAQGLQLGRAAARPRGRAARWQHQPFRPLVVRRGHPDQILWRQDSRPKCCCQPDRAVRAYTVRVAANDAPDPVPAAAASDICGAGGQHRGLPLHYRLGDQHGCRMPGGYERAWVDLVGRKRNVTLSRRLLRVCQQPGVLQHADPCRRWSMSQCQR